MPYSKETIHKERIALIEQVNEFTNDLKNQLRNKTLTKLQRQNILNHIKTNKNLIKRNLEQIKINNEKPNLKPLKESLNAIMIREKPKPPFHKGIANPQQTTFSRQNVSGVYMIFIKSKLVYVGFSKKDVYKALYRHFYPYNDKQKQKRKYFTNLKYLTVSVIYTKTPAQAYHLEKALIIKYKPKLNTIQYSINYDMDKTEKALLETFEKTKAIVIDDGEPLPF